MARNLYGCTSADFTLTESGRVVAGATATVWTARTGGTQVTDLTDLDGDAITLVTSDADGGIRFYGVDGDKDAYWLDTGTGARIAVRPADLTGEIGPTPDLTIGTVTTGTAAATITGTDADPVLNLTLPTAGANGVNTAAIQDGAVTSAKIADGTITGTDVAASTFAAFGTVGNLLTANQAGCVSGFDSNGTITYGSPAAGSLTVAGSPAYIIATNVAVSPGDVVTSQAVLAPTGGPVNVSVYWRRADGTDIGPTTSANVAAGTTALATVTGAAPAEAASAVLVIYPLDGATSIVVTKPGLWKGAGGQWAMPGVPITNTGIRPNPANTAEVQIWNDATATWITV